MEPHDVKRILADQGFRDTVAELQTQLTGKVMAVATTKKDRKKALAESHALTRLVAMMTSTAQNAKDDQ